MTAARQLKREGERIGIEKYKLAIARGMLKKGFDIDTIQELIGLSKQTIEEVKRG